jgi:hypothetical protein
MGAAPGAGEAAAPAAPSGGGDTAGSALGEAGSGSMASAAGNMIGDLAYRGYAITRTTSGGFVRTPLTEQGAFKIAENESPRPKDRIFVTGNFFESDRIPGVANFPQTNDHFSLYRGVAGFECTLCDGCASVGARVPLMSSTGHLPEVRTDGIGDVTIIVKWALIDDCYTGNVLSGGLAITVPTSRDVVLADGNNIHSVLVQPWVGYLFNTDCWSWDPRCYVIGFTSAFVPTEREDATFLSTDLGLGYRMYLCRDGSCISAIIPTVEAHYTAALTHHGLNNGSLVELPDQVIVTGGVHIGLGCDKAWFTVAAARPVTGPRPYEVEFIAQLNLNF